MAYNNNEFCWHGLDSTDTAKSSAFYPAVLGWKVVSMPMGDSTATLFTAADEGRAHLSPLEQGQSTWNNYLRVEDVDASTAAAAEAGGAVVFPPTDIPPGRFSMVTSPSGALMALYHEADEATAVHPPGGPGAVHWVELHSQDVQADLTWLKTVFGFTIGEMPMGPGMTYYLLRQGETMSGGVMPAMDPSAKSAWMVWFEVDDADAAVARAVEAGGSQLGEFMDQPTVGRMAMVLDDTGAAFGVIKPAAS